LQKLILSIRSKELEKTSLKEIRIEVVESGQKKQIKIPDVNWDVSTCVPINQNAS